MIIECLPTGMFQSNTYIIGQGGEGIVIDAGAQADEIYEKVQTLSLNIKYIILTHGHIDHICSIDELKDKMTAKVLIHREDAECLANPRYNASVFFGESLSYGRADKLVEEGDILEAGGLKIEIIHSPGHTPGCICVKVEENVFTGDTLFKLGIGRTDLEHGSYEDIINSINDKLMKLSDNVRVYPGHGEPTTIGYERANNPYVR